MASAMSPSAASAHKRLIFVALLMLYSFRLRRIKYYYKCTMHREKGNTGLTCLQRGKERKWLLNKKYCKTYLIGGGGKERQLLKYI